MEEKEKSGDEQTAERTYTEIVKCAGCGANMVFHPETQSLICPHCGSKKEFAEYKQAKELELLGGLVKDDKWSGDKETVFMCENCGANVVLAKGETATDCPFCGTSHVKKKEELSGIKPNAVVPFIFGSDVAATYAKKWAKSKIFAPRGFKKNLVSESIKGVYTPCFTFDSHTSSSYDGRIGTTHTRTVCSGKDKRVETYVVWRNIRGTEYLNFDDVLTTAGSKFDQKKLDKISPYATNAACSFKEEYLLGFMAYHYDRPIEYCWECAKLSMDKKIRKEILSHYVYDEFGYLNVSTTHEEVTYKYVMLPVYVGNFRHKKKVYNYYVNGTTGKTWGKSPKSLWKILGTIFASAAVIGLIYLLLTYFC